MSTPFEHLSESCAEAEAAGKLGFTVETAYSNGKVGIGLSGEVLDIKANGVSVVWVSVQAVRDWLSRIEFLARGKRPSLGVGPPIEHIAPEPTPEFDLNWGEITMEDEA